MAGAAGLVSRLNRKITIQTTTQSLNSYGDTTDAWATYHVAMASVKAYSGREYWNGGQNKTEESWSFRVPYCKLAAAVTTKMRISYNGDAYDIQSVINMNEENRVIEIMAVKHGN